ncbi:MULTISPECIES: tyrosine-type recombinase/integrase [Polaromonas]|uniref:Tyrosine-type recombinase/integrase n=1 Tax=Polaromonas aquatica TaxID=332657 RepID=A0ABW1TRL8_9BURK
MSLYRRTKAAKKAAAKTWWVDFTDANGKRHRVSTGTDNRQLASEFEAKYRAEIFKAQVLGEKGADPFPLAIERFLDEKKRKDVHVEYERQLEWWDQQFKLALKTEVVRMKKIDKALILKVIAIKAKTATDATCNRYLSALRACLRLAHKKYDMLAEVPAFFMKEEPKGRVRWITPEEVQALINELPQHLRSPCVIALTTGLRRSVVCLLQWSQIDLDAMTLTVSAEDMKNEEHHVVPLPDLAMQVLRAEVGKHAERVWTFRGKPFDCFAHRTWKKAKERAGIEDFRWHDLRHTWATMLTQSGASDGVLQMLGCWKSVQMVRKYAHHNVASVRPTAALVDGKLGGVSLSLVKPTYPVGGPKKRDPEVLVA